ncbi:MAG: hypothetical protein QG608_2889 [Actinomycetota bacterium]|nr:hypothetical protein [Actinomycetota bacterium]
MSERRRFIGRRGVLLLTTVLATASPAAAVAAPARVPARVSNPAAAALPAPVPSPAAVPSSPTMGIGYSHACWIKLDATLWCWGYALFGRTGNGEQADPNTPVLVGSQEDRWIDVGAGHHHTCGVRDNGTLWCWGSDLNGEIGDGPGLGDGLIQVGAETTWAAVSAGSTFTCGLRRDRSLWCWGSHAATAPGDGPSRRDSPTQVTGQWTAVEAGPEHTCAIREGGTLWCWGSNFSGQLGDGTLTTRRSPVQVGRSTDWTAVSSGTEYTCGLRGSAKSAGTLWCWGSNTDGGLGNGTRIHRYVPGLVGDRRDWVQVAAGARHVCGRTADGTVWCWGDNRYGQVADGSTIDRYRPTPVPGGRTWRGVWSGPFLTCGTQVDGHVHCWGEDEYGQLSLGDSKVMPSPHRLPGGGWAELSSGGYHTCALRRDTTVWCWGENSYGQLGDGLSSSTSSAPVRVGVPDAEVRDTFRTLSAGAMYTCAIRSNGTLWCWGQNWDGQLGNGSGFSSQPTPTQVAPGTVWHAVSAGTGHTCGVRRDRSLWCWGDNSHGQLGDGTHDTALAPVPVQAGGLWKAVSVGRAHTCALRSEGSVWCWGGDESGQLGLESSSPAGAPASTGTDGPTDDTVRGSDLPAVPAPGPDSAVPDVPLLDSRRPLPDEQDPDLPDLPDPSDPGVGGSGADVLAPTRTGQDGPWARVVSGQDSTCALRPWGTLSCWGEDDFVLGRLPASAWTSLDVDDTLCAVRNTGSLWCEGENAWGQLGAGTRAPLADPVPVGPGGGWAQVDNGLWHACGLRFDGSLSCWGSNKYGQLGVLNPTMVRVSDL